MNEEIHNIHRKEKLYRYNIYTLIAMANSNESTKLSYMMKNVSF